MDYPQQQSDFNREVMRRLAEMERQQSQFFSPYQIQVGHRQNPKLAKTIADEDADPDYPAANSGATVFPITFLSGGFTNTAGVQTGQYTDHDEVPQAKVFCVTGKYIPEDTVIQVWQDIGTDATYPGQWWTDFNRGTLIGKPDSNISANASGTISIYKGSDRTDSGINVTAYTIVALTATKWVTVEDVDGYYYAFKWEC